MNTTKPLTPTPFLTRYKTMLLTKGNLIISMLVFALMFGANLMNYMNQTRALFLCFIYCVFMIIYQAITAKFLPEDKYQIFEDEGQTALGNPIGLLPQFGRVLHYLLIGGMFSIALGATDANPDAFFRGFSNMGLIYAAVYGLFNEMSLKRQKKAQQENDE